jgi:hypothetical protein
MRFASGTQYVCSWNQTITWGGHDWIGVGTIASISSIEESETVEPRSLTFSLATPSSYLALAVGSVEEYRGRTVVVYICPLDENYVLVGTPEICWRGVMDEMAVSVDGAAGSITLKAENALSALRRRPSARMNAAQQKKLYPTDTSFDYLADLIAHPQQWLSKRFQQV